MAVPSTFTPVRHFNRNESGRDFVIGDLHGCQRALQVLMKHVNFDKTVDRMFSVGDLVDRGPHNLACLSLMYEDWFHVVRGNHEELMVDCMLGNNSTACNLWVDNGGNWIYDIQDRGEVTAICKDVVNLPYVIVIGDGEDRINIAHAELFVSNAMIDEWSITNVIPEYMRQMIVWGRRVKDRKIPYGFVKDDLSFTICGHNIRPFGLIDYVREANHLLIDTGAYIGTWPLVDRADHTPRLTMVNITNKYTFEITTCNTINYSIAETYTFERPTQQT
jgi:serine/threonine protein phosphatase 1